MNSKLLRLLWLVCFFAGLFAVGARFVLGKDLAAYNGYVPWGLWVAVYLYFVGMSAGLFFITAIAWGFRVRALEPIRKLAPVLAAVTLVGGLVTIVQDLGRPFRAWKVLLQPNPGSMMAWMIWMYTAYLILLVLVLLLLFRDQLKGGLHGFADGLAARIGGEGEPGANGFEANGQGPARRLILLGVPLAIGFSGGVGALFGVIGARPAWNSALLPLLFLVGALLSGTALLTATVAFFWRQRTDDTYRHLLRTLAGGLLGLLTVYLLFEWAELSINLYASIPAHSSAFRLVLFGPYWWAFWILHLGIGSLVPLALLAPRANREKPALVGLAAALVALTFLAVRVNIVIPGLALEELEGLSASYRDARLHFDYFPNAWEWGVTLFAFSLVALLFFLAARHLPILGAGRGISEANS